MWAKLLFFGGINRYNDIKPNVAFISCLPPDKYSKDYTILLEKIKGYKIKN